MPNFLTSYTWRGVELNDGVSYLVPTAGSDFDSQNSASIEYATRQYATPFLLGATLQPGEIPLTIFIVANTPQLFDQKLKVLAKIFDTSNPVAYPFYRKLGHEASYRSVSCTVASFVPSRLERKVEIRLSTEDRRWKDAAETTVVYDLFDTLITETHVINNAGFVEVEPVIQLKALEAPSGGSTNPQYWRHVAIYCYETRQALNSPVLLVDDWDQTALVASNKVRSDGKDISVVIKGTATLVPRYVCGTVADRRIWVRPESLPLKRVIVLPGTATEPKIDAVQTSIDVFCGEVVGQPLVPAFLPTAGAICLDDELITYTGITYNGTDKSNITLTGCTRGASGTTAATHGSFTRVKQPYEFTIRYGYGAGYETLFSNQIAYWPPADYEVSTNKEWVVEFSASGRTNMAAEGAFYMSSEPMVNRRPRTGELVFGRKSPDIGDQDTRANQRPALYGGYVVGGSEPPKLERLVYSIPTTNRIVESFRSKTRMKAGTGTSGHSAVCSISVVRNNFNTSFEYSEVLATQTHSSTTPAVLDTGYLATNVRTKGGAHIVFDAVTRAQPPIGSTYFQFVVPETLYLKLDTAFGAYPTAGSLQVEQGVATGDFPVQVTIENLTTGDYAFVINALMRVNEVLTIDADARTVEEEKLTYVSFTNPTWLRLISGNNSIKFTAVLGAGSVEATISWRNRY